jgi:hypothetical protein
LDGQKVTWLKESFSNCCSFLTNHACPAFVLNYRDREKILLAMSLDPAKSGGHEVCNPVRTRLYCVCNASLRGFTTALPCKASAAV